MTGVFVCLIAIVAVAITRIFGEDSRVAVGVQRVERRSVTHDRASISARSCTFCSATAWAEFGHAARKLKTTPTNRVRQGRRFYSLVQSRPAYWRYTGFAGLFDSAIAA